MSNCRTLEGKEKEHIEVVMHKHIHKQIKMDNVSTCGNYIIDHLIYEVDCGHLHQITRQGGPTKWKLTPALRLIRMKG